MPLPKATQTKNLASSGSHACSGPCRTCGVHEAFIADPLPNPKLLHFRQPQQVDHAHQDRKSCLRRAQLEALTKAYSSQEAFHSSVEPQGFGRLWTAGFRHHGDMEHEAQQLRLRPLSTAGQQLR